MLFGSSKKPPSKTLIPKRKSTIEKPIKLHYPKYTRKNTLIKALIAYSQPYPIICVDLDGTLILEESIPSFLKRSWYKPHTLFNIIKSRFRSKLHAKAYIASQIKEWTIREWLFKALVQLKTKYNKQIYLVTGSHEELATRIANSLTYKLTVKNKLHQILHPHTSSDTEQQACNQNITSHSSLSNIDPFTTHPIKEIITHPIKTIRQVRLQLHSMHNKSYHLFDGIIASSTAYDCISLNKLNQMQIHFTQNNTSHTSQHNTTNAHINTSQSFLYIGNSSQDIPIFYHTRTGCLITNNKSLIQQAPESVLILPDK